MRLAPRPASVLLVALLVLLTLPGSFGAAPAKVAGQIQLTDGGFSGDAANVTNLMASSLLQLADGATLQWGYHGNLVQKAVNNSQGGYVLMLDKSVVIPCAGVTNLSQALSLAVANEGIGVYRLADCNYSTGGEYDIPEGVSIIGSAPRLCKITRTGDFTIFKFGGTDNFPNHRQSSTIQGCWLNGDNKGAAPLIHAAHMRKEFALRDLWLTNAAEAIRFEVSVECTCQHIRMENVGKGITYDDLPNNTSNFNNFQDIVIWKCGVGIITGDGTNYNTNNNFINVYFETCDYGINATHGNSHTFLNLAYEDTGVAINIVGDLVGSNFVNGFFTGNTEDVNASNGKGNKFYGNKFTAPVRLSGSATYNQFFFNRYDTSSATFSDTSSAKTNIRMEPDFNTNVISAKGYGIHLSNSVSGQSAQLKATWSPTGHYATFEALDGGAKTSTNGVMNNGYGATQQWDYIGTSIKSMMYSDRIAYDLALSLNGAQKLNFGTTNGVGPKASLFWDSGLGSLKLTEGAILGYRTNLSDVSFATMTTGDTASRIAIRANGSISSGSGTGGHDTWLARESAGVLKLDGGLKVASFVQFEDEALGTCDETKRFREQWLAGAVGVADKKYVCAKSASDTYGWAIMYTHT